MNIAVLNPYLALMRVDRQIGTLLLLWPTLWGLWLASNGQPDLKNSVTFILGVIVMRAAGCVINDYADRNFDGKVSRTAQRPLATQKLAPCNALMLFGALLSIALVLALQLHWKTLALSVIAAILTIIYPFAKRFTNYPQVILGAAFAWGIPMVYMQLQNQLPPQAVILFLSTLAWVVAFDTQYAMADKSDDVKIGIKSTAIAFGNYDRIMIAILQILSIAGLCWIGNTQQLAWPYYLALACALVLSMYQQILIKDKEPKKCIKAFLNNNYFGMLVFVGFIFGLQ